MLLALTEIIVSVLVFAFFVTQVVLPIWKGTILMPFFRRSAKDLKDLSLDLAVPAVQGK